MGWWTHTACAALTALGFLAFAYVTEGRERPTRVEVQRIVATESPYLKDRELILHQLKVSGEQIIALQLLVQDSVRQQAGLRSEVQTLVKILEERDAK